MSARRCAYSLLAPSLILAAIGCSRSVDELPREPVGGTVTMDDQPLAKAVILFSPIGEASDKTTGATAEIKDGAFTIPREHGLVPGTYKVSISHAPSEAVKSKAKGELTKRTRLGKELIPARYNTKSEIKAEIKPGGTTDLKFPLQSK